MSNRREKLALALELAKQKLAHDGTGIERIPSSSLPNSEAPKSKMNRLLGKDTVQDTRKHGLLQRTQVVQRPTFELVANSILGKESKRRQPSIDLQANGDSLSDIAARRIRSLRQRTYDEIEQNDVENQGEYVGIEHNGLPIWKSVLDRQRGQKTQTEPDIRIVEENSAFHHSVLAPVEGAWPQRLRPEVRKSFKQWFTVPENLRATQAVEAIIDAPGGALNPMLILGGEETGRTHLLHATAQAILRRQEGNVYLLTAADLINLERLPAGWQDTLVNARMLAIDDLHMVVNQTEIAHELGMMVDYALNMGVHLLLSSKTEPEQWPTSRLWEVTRHAATVAIQRPSSTSMVLYARNLAQKRGLIIGDGQLASLVLRDEIGWRSTKSNFDLVALAVESGQDIIDGDDVTALLSNQTLPSGNSTILEREKVEDIATRLIDSAVDTVYSDEIHGGIELYSPLPEIGTDEYTPPELDAQELSKSADERHAEYLRIALEDTAPAAPSVLKLHEREEHLIARKGHIEERDYGLAAEVLTELDEAFDKQINAFERELMQSSAQLSSLETKLENISNRTSEATIEELISIADELRSMEKNLVEFDPEREPWPEMEDDQPPTSKRQIGRQKSTSKEDLLDSHEPEGEWNIDARNVDMMDLLDENDKIHKIQLSRIKKIAKLVAGEEE